MSENQTVRRRKVLAAVLVVIISGAVITSAFLFLTYPRPEIETLLIDEIDLPFNMFVYYEFFNLTIPSTVSYIQVILNQTSGYIYSC
ncbi:MAG: hypothetical protein ACXABY_24475, partial [Candidatus Thorarchaeota archaeon]